LKTIEKGPCHIIGILLDIERNLARDNNASPRDSEVMALNVSDIASKRSRWSGSPKSAAQFPACYRYRARS